MTFRRRLCVISVILAFALITYGVARRYSATIVIYVAEQALLQKSPPGSNPVVIRQRFRAQLSVLPDEDARLKRALTLSQYVEKLQRLSNDQLESLLR